MQLEAKRLAKTLATVEGSLQGDYLLSAFSAADIGVGQAVYMAQHFVSLDAFPKLFGWFDLLQARPAFRKSLPDKQWLYAKPFYPPWPVQV